MTTPTSPMYGDYATLSDVRSTYLGSDITRDDALILKMIHQASIDIDQISKRKFYPRLETRLFDTPLKSYDLVLDQELLDLIEVSNGDGVALTISDLKLYPYNAHTHRVIRLLPNVSTWKNSPAGFPDGAISVKGIWCDAADYSTGWLFNYAMTDALTTSSSSFTATSGLFLAGMLICIDDEFMYVKSVIPPVSPAVLDTVNIIRAVNGTVAAIHDIADVAFYWNPGREIIMLTCAAAAAYYHLKSNPAANSYTLDGVTFQTPQDVADFIRRRLVEINIIRIGIA